MYWKFDPFKGALYLTGDMDGPASSTDNTLVRFDGTSGKRAQSSGIVVDDSNNMSGIGTLASGAVTITGALSTTGAATLGQASGGALTHLVQSGAGTTLRLLTFSAANTDLEFYTDNTPRAKIRYDQGNLRLAVTNSGGTQAFYIDTTSGNGQFLNALGVTGATTLAALSATTGSFSSTLAAGKTTITGARNQLTLNSNGAAVGTSISLDINTSGVNLGLIGICGADTDLGAGTLDRDLVIRNGSAGKSIRFLVDNTLVGTISSAGALTTLAGISCTTLAASSNSTVGGTLGVSGTLTIGSIIDTAAAGTLNIGTANATTINIGTGASAQNINIGGAGDTVYIAGTLAWVDVTDLKVTDKVITLNKGGAAASGDASGIEIEENAIATGYAKAGNSRLSWDFKAPASSGAFRLTTPSGAFTMELISAATANRTWTLPDFSDTFVGRDSAQTLLLKTLTSPTITGAAISGGTISSTPISGSTGSFTTLASSGLSTLDSLSVTNNATVGGTLAVTGASTLGVAAGTAAVQTIYGKATASGNLPTILLQAYATQFGANGSGAPGPFATATKIGWLLAPHYTSTEESIGFAGVVSNGSVNSISIGGGTGDYNAVTSINFYTASGVATTGGTDRGGIDSAGRWTAQTAVANTLTLKSTLSSVRSNILFDINGITKGLLGIAASTSDMITNDAADDFVIRTNAGGRIVLGITSTIAAVLNSGGQFDLVGGMSTDNQGSAHRIKWKTFSTTLASATGATLTVSGTIYGQTGRYTDDGINYYAIRTQGTTNAYWNSTTSLTTIQLYNNTGATITYYAIVYYI